MTRLPDDRENAELQRSASVHMLHHLRDAFALSRLPLAEARQLPGEMYFSPVVEALEKKRIWTKTWLCIAREEEISAGGDFMTFDIAGESVLLTRDEAGHPHAFINKCRHRGVPVAQGRGNTKQFSCPYHAWLYGLDGSLLTAPHMKRTHVDLSLHGLTRLHLACWRGWIFVNFDAAPVSFPEFIAPYDSAYWWFRSDEVKLADVKRIPVQCNWKLLVENLLDMYHVPVIHKGTFGPFSKTPRDQIKCKLLAQGGWELETEARPHAKDGRQMFLTLPWMSQKSEGVSIKGGIFPNLNISTRSDCLRVWAIWPVTTGSCELSLYTLYAPSSLELPDFRDSHQEGQEFLLRAILEEDGPMVVALQKSVESPRYLPGPMCFLEDGIHHIINYYLDVIAPTDELAVSIENSATE